jgi:hypothetical protein
MHYCINRFQALDLVFFGALKKSKASAVGECDDDSANAEITKLVQVYEQTAISSTMWGSFRKAGMHLYVAIWSFRIRFVEQTRRENPGFREARHRHVLLDDRREQPTQ